MNDLKIPVLSNGIQSLITNIKNQKVEKRHKNGLLILMEQAI